MAAPVAFFLFIATALFLVHTHAHLNGLELDELSRVLQTAPPGFSYTGNDGPNKWGSLSPIYEPCAKGKWQSPINIEKGKVVLNKNLKPLMRNYYLTNATLFDKGYNVGVQFGKAGVLIVDGKNYSLLQMHWHIPSEHKIDGVTYDAELHLVHKAIDGSASVVSILYKLGHADPIIAKIQRKLSELTKEVRERNAAVGEVELGTFKTQRLRKKTHKYYRYGGSLTTPPCSENVIWHILAKVRSISKEQIEALDAPLLSTCKRNFRPVQPLNGRQVELFDDRLP